MAFKLECHQVLTARKKLDRAAERYPNSMTDTAIALCLLHLADRCVAPTYAQRTFTPVGPICHQSPPR